MRMTCTLLFLSVLMSPVFATKPCMLLSKTQFITEVGKQSDLVALVNIQEISPENNLKWTKALIDEKILDKKNETANVITINKWRANDEPLFSYKVGDKLILWLRKVGNAYELTNNNWNYCEPAIWPTIGNTIQPAFNDGTNSINNMVGVKKFITEM